MESILKVSVTGTVFLLLFIDIYSRDFLDSAQINNYNSTQEEVIFEYDTVLLPPDTIRITDTITIIDDSTRKAAKRQVGNNTKIFFIPSRYINHSISFQISPFLTNQHFNNDEVVDSVRYSNSQPLNFSYELFYSIQLYNWSFTTGANFIHFSEKSEKRDIFIKETVTETTINTIRETIYLENYFFYAGLFLGISYNIKIKPFYVNPELDVIISKSLSANNRKFSSGSSVKNVAAEEQYENIILMGISMPIEYRMKDIAFFLKPSLLGNINDENKFPHTLKYAYRLGFGIKYIF